MTAKQNAAQKTTSKLATTTDNMTDKKLPEIKILKKAAEEYYLKFANI